MPAVSLKTLISLTCYSAFQGLDIDGVQQCFCQAADEDVQQGGARPMAVLAAA